MEFCPSCGTLCQFALPHMSHPSRFICPTCPYVSHIGPKVKIKRKQHLVKKVIEPVFTKDDWKSGAITEGVRCPNCGHNRAAFLQMQTRSADEPMTIFHKCLNCECEWRES